MKISAFWSAFDKPIDWPHVRCETNAAEFVVKDVIVLKRGGGVVGDFYACGTSFVDAITFESRMRLCRDEHARLCIAIDLVLFEKSFAFVENAHASVASVEDFVLAQDRIRVSLYPHARHGIVEDLVLLESA